jgi:hypothetical protein
MSKPGYIIVEAHDLEHLRGYVNDAIGNGYRPLGGPVKCHDGHAFEYGARDQWAQALALEGCRP